MDFNAVDFNEFSFDNGFAGAYTKQMSPPRKFNYIIFKYISDDKYPCAVNSITARYKFNDINRGVK